ncbi:MAG TPA: right-handed parallel beta-helix repeat-containing protein [Myxococcota bacterium]|nr:right-handed parallel beta-helix repeat-containing protein [Myxococcota bacterium]
MLILLAPAWGATLSVPGDHSTIQAAIDAASSGDTITVAAGTYEEAVDTSGKNLTLTGDGPSTTIIDATGETHAVSVDEGETVTISGFELTGSDQGLEVRGSTVTASSIRVNNVTGKSNGGGYLVTNGATLTISSCNVKNVELTNSQYGAGFFVDGSTLTASNCTVSGNTAYQGGGFYITDSTADLTDVTVEDNTAEWHGGGFRIRDGSTVTMTRVTVDSNVAADNGGGVDVRDSDLACQNCVVTNNSSGLSGAGAYIEGSNSSSGSWFRGATAEINDNAAGGNGGGIYSWDTKMEVRGEMDGNTAAASTIRGPAIYFGGGTKLTLRDCTIMNHSSDSGAVYVIDTGSGEDLAVDTCTFEDNTATEEGAAIWSSAPIYIQDGDFTSNTADIAGGAIFADEGKLEVYDSTFTANSGGSQGGAIRVYRAAMTLKRSTFLTNTSDVGGAVFHHANDASGATGTLSKNSFQRNTATTSGGAVYADAPKSWISSQNDFDDNSPEGVYVIGANSFKITSDSYSGNAEEGLKAVSIDGSYMENTSFRGNLDGGAYYSASGSHIVTNSVFIGNGGTGLTVSDATGAFVVQNSDAVGNGERGFSVEYGEGVTLVNDIAAFNDGDGFRAYSISDFVITYNDSHDNGTDWGQGLSDLTGLDGNISKDPDYTGWSVDDNADNDILYLSSTSPCRDAGDPDITDTDGSRSDMGSFGGPEAADEDDDGDGYKPSDGDCDNDDASVYPGATDTWYDGVDSDCDGADDYDADGDGFRHESGGDPPEETDCDDTDGTIYPNADEVLDDGIDQNCDGVDGIAPEDTGDTDDTDTGTSPTDSGIPGWWDDNDGDGQAPAQGDCDDEDPWVYRDAIEQCDDGKDNDCDGAGDDIDADCQGSAACFGCSGGGAAAASVLTLLGMLLMRRRRDE